MSANDKGIEFIIGADLTPLASALASVEAKVDQTGAKFDTLNTKIEGGAKKATDAFGGLGSSATKAGDSAKQAGDRGSSSMQSFTTETKKAESSVLALSETTKGLVAVLGAVGLNSAFHGLTSDIMKCVETFGSFQSTLNQVKAVTGATGSEMRQMQDLAIKMGQETKFSANEAAQGMVRMAKDGFDTKQIMAALPGVLALAAASNTDVDATARIAAGSLRSFGMEASDMGKVADIMARAVNASGMDLQQMGETIKYVGPIAQAAGQSMLNMSAEIALMGKNMISGSQAGTTLRGVLTRLAAPPKEAAKELAALKIVVNDAHGAMLPFPVIVEQIRRATAGMGEAAKLAAVGNISGRYALSGLMALVNEAPDSFGKMKDRLDETGSASKIAKTQMEGLQGSIKLTTSSIETAEKVLGEQLAPAAIAVADTIRGVADAVSGANTTFLAVVTSTAVAVTAFTGMAGAAATASGAYMLIRLAAEGQAAASARVAAETATAAQAEATALEAAAAQAVAAYEAVTVAAAGAGTTMAGQEAILAAQSGMLAAQSASTTAALTAETLAIEAEAAAAVTGAEAMSLFLASLLPVAIPLAVIAAAVGGVTYALWANNQAIEENKKYQEEQTQGRADAIGKSMDMRDELGRLVDQHDKLAAKTKRTTDEEHLLRDINEKLIKNYPDLANAIDITKTATLKGLPAIDAETARRKAAEDQIYRQLDAEVALATFLMQSAGINAKSKHQELDSALEEAGGADTNGGMSGARNAMGVLKAKRESGRADEEYMNSAARLAAGRQALDQAKRRRAPAAPTPLDTGGGKASTYTDPSKKTRKGGGDKSAKGEVAKDNEARQHAEQMAQATMKVEEAKNAQILSMDKARYAAEMNFLQTQLQQKYITEVDYAERAGQANIEMANAEARAAVETINLQMKAAQEKYDADKKAETDALNDTKLNATDRAKLSQKAKDLAEVDAQSIAALQVKHEQAVQDGLVKVSAAEHAAFQQRMAAIAAVAVANQKLEGDIQKDERETADLTASHNEQSLAFFDRLWSSTQRYYKNKMEDEDRAYLLQVANIDATIADDVKKTAAIKAADDAHLARQTAIGDEAVKAARKASSAWVSTFSDINGTITGLLTNPSFSSVGSLAEQIAGDPGKIDEWVDSVHKASDAMKDFGANVKLAMSGGEDGKDGISGIASAIGASVPVLGTAVTLIGAFAGAIQQAGEQTKALNQSVKDLDIDTEKRIAARITDPAFKDAWNKAADQDDLDNQTQKAYEKIRDEAHAGPFGGLHTAWSENFKDALNDPSLPDQDRKQIQSLLNNYGQKKQDLDDKYTKNTKNAKKQDGIDGELADIDEQTKQGIIDDGSTQKVNALKAAAKKQITLQREAQESGDWDGVREAAAQLEHINELLKMQKGLHEEGAQSQKDQTKELSEYNNGIERLVALQKDLNAGHDRYGSQVTLNAEAEDKAAQKREDRDRSHNKFLAESKKLRDDLLKIDKDETDEINKILNQGLAERTDTESQYKNKEVAKIHEKATADRTAKQQQLDDLIENDRVSQQNYNNEITSIIAIAAEKTRANQTEQDQIRANLVVLNQELNLQRSITDEINRRKNGGYAITRGNDGAYSSGGGSLPAGADGSGQSIGSSYIYSDKEVRAKFPGYATGGIKDGDGLAYLHNQEVILNQDQQNRFWQYLTSPMPTPAARDILAVSRASTGAPAQAGGGGNISATFTGPVNFSLSPGGSPQMIMDFMRQLGGMARQRGGNGMNR